MGTQARSREKQKQTVGGQQEAEGGKQEAEGNKQEKDGGKLNNCKMNRHCDMGTMNHQ